MNTAQISIDPSKIRINDDGNLLISDKEVAKAMQEALQEIERAGNDAKIKILCCNLNIVCP